MSEKPIFTPSSYHTDESALSSKYTEDEIMHARAEVEREQAKRHKRLHALEIAWAIISTIFAIISWQCLEVAWEGISQFQGWNKLLWGLADQ